MRIDMQKISEALKHLKRHSFFRSIGNFKGINQESLVLQKATGYSQVYRTWNILRRAYSLNDGYIVCKLKIFATLYEILVLPSEVSHIVKQQLHLED